MSIIANFKKQIADLQKQINVIQEQCSHPPFAVKRVAKSDTGNWDPGDDRYWYECDCGLCEKHWDEPQ